MHIGTIVWTVTSAALLLIATVAIVAANLSMMAMIDEMNGNLPPEKRMRPVGYWPGKTAYIFTAYPDVCPGGKTRSRTLRRLGVALALLFSYLRALLGRGSLLGRYCAPTGPPRIGRISPVMKLEVCGLARKT